MNKRLILSIFLIIMCVCAFSSCGKVPELDDRKDTGLYEISSMEDFEKLGFPYKFSPEDVGTVIPDYCIYKNNYKYASATQVVFRPEFFDQEMELWGYVFINYNSDREFTDWSLFFVTKDETNALQFYLKDAGLRDDLRRNILGYLEPYGDSGLNRIDLNTIVYDPTEN